MLRRILIQYECNPLYSFKRINEFASGNAGKRDHTGEAVMRISLGKKLAAALSFAVMLGFGGTLLPSIGVPAANAQSESAEPVDRSATGGAQTLDDILRRQRGEDVPLDAGTGSPEGAAASGQLGTLGGLSDSELWRKARQGETFTVSIPDKKSATLMQDEGEAWLATREGPLTSYSLYAFGGILLLLAFFLLLRGRIRIQQGWSSVKIERFTFIERFGHWLLAGSFLILAVTGFALLFGREYLIPAIDWTNAKMNGGEVTPGYGKEIFASFVGVGKWLHNNIAWAFVVSLVLIFFMWVLRNIPTWTDVKWFAQGGGLFSKDSHPHARKFNGGQKLIFWSVIIFGASISASGLSLLAPYEYPMFAPTFEKLNSVSEAIGFPLGLATTLTPIQEMQYSQMWHTIIATVLMIIIIAHIYIGSIGMQGAFGAMGSGKVDLNWAKEHHDLWVEEMVKDGKVKLPMAKVPAEPKRNMPMSAPTKPNVPAE